MTILRPAQWLIDWSDASGASFDPIAHEEVGTPDSFVYTESLDEDDSKLVLTWKKCVRTAADHEAFLLGNFIKASFGRSPLSSDLSIKMLVDSVSMDYSSGIGLKVTCKDSGSRLTKGVSSRKFEKMTIEDIFNAVVKSYGNIESKYSISKTISGKKITAVQNNESDFAFLMRIASKYGLKFYFIGNILYLKTDQEPEIAFVHDYGSGGWVKSISITTEENEKSPGLGAAGVRYNAGTGEFEKPKTEDGKGDRKDAGTKIWKGGYVEAESGFDGDAEIIEREPPATVKVTVSEQDPTDASIAAARNYRLKLQQATINLPGTEQYHAGLFVILTGVSDIHSGIWRVNEVKHKITATGYETQAKLDREALGDSASSNLVDVKDKHDGDPALTDSDLLRWAIGAEAGSENLQ